MPRLSFSADSLSDLERLHEFLEGKSPEAWLKAKTAIIAEIGKLSTQAGIHKPVPDRKHQHDMQVKFGALGYTIRYQFERGGDTVVVLRMKHQRENDFL
ncbi:MAG: type II toxin-antitoxin system RelE/ParE family toxin [Rhodoferax sp.]|nr:type II toxin-antitoxin system RelE/ParE family toxin [Rhodoferax sp.]